MEPIAYVDLVSAAAALAGAFFVLFGWRRKHLSAGVPILLLVVLLLTAFYGFGLFLEWSGLAGRIQWNFFENFGGVLVAFVWAFLFYALIKDRIEQELTDSRRHYRNLVETTSDWFWEVDTQGRYTYCSPQVEQMLGWRPQELLGKTPFDVMIPDEAARVRAVFERCVSEAKPFSGLENICLHRDGRQVYLETSGVPVFDPQGRLVGYRGVDRDITERRRIRQMLETYQAEISSIFSASPIGIGLVRQRRLIHGNERFFDLSGYSAEDLLGQDPRKLYLSQADYAEVGRLYVEALSGGIAAIETRWRRKDGRIIDVQMHIAPLDSPDAEKGFVIMAHDITAAKAARQALKDNEAFLRLIFDGIQDGLCVLDTQFNIVRANVYQQQRHCRKGSQIGRKCYEVYHGLSAPCAGCPSLKAMETGQTQSAVVPMTEAGRPTGWLEINAFPMQDASGAVTGVIEHVRDITQRRQIEEALEENRRAQTTLMGNLPGAAFRCLDQPDWPMQFISKGCLELTGYTDQEFICQHVVWRKLIVPADRARVWEEIRQALKNRTNYQIVYRIRTKDGQEKWMWEKGCGVYDADGEVAAIEGFITDITERQKIREALMFTQFSVDHAGEAMFWMTHKGRVVYANDAACRSLGLDRSRLLEMSVWDFAPSLTPQRWQQHWQELKEKQTLRFESQHRRSNGSVFPVEVTANFLVCEDAEYNCAIVRDITERRCAEQTRQLLLQQLQTRNEELQSIVFIAAHDLRSPLVNIAGFAGELEKDLARLTAVLQEAAGSLPPQADTLLRRELPESLRFIKAGSSKMQALLDGLSRLSRIGTLQINPQQLDMAALMQSAVADLNFQITACGAQVDIEPNLPPCRGDAVLIRQVFANLVDNAVKYRRPDRPCRIRIAGRSCGDGRVEYAVSDNGIGIPPEHIDKVFELFHQLCPDRSNGGQGLGLPIVRRILDHQDGSVRMESQPDVGTTVYVQLPAAGQEQ